MSQSSPTCTRGLYTLCISPSLAVGTPLCGQRARLQEGTAVSCKPRSLQHQGLLSGKVMWVPTWGPVAGRGAYANPLGFGGCIGARHLLLVLLVNSPPGA